jgi:hypothetical protein
MPTLVFGRRNVILTWGDELDVEPRGAHCPLMKNESTQPQLISNLSIAISCEPGEQAILT